MPMQVQTPNGLMQVQIPPGLQPGMAFLIQVPQPTSSAPRNSAQRNEGAEEVAMQTSVSAAPREAQETQLDPEWIAARQASLEIAAREASLETQLDPDWIAAREASLVEAKRMAERGSLEEAALEQALALSLAQPQEATKPGPSSLGAEVAALEAEIAALQAGHTMDQMQEPPVQDSSAVPFGLPANDVWEDG